MVSGNGELWAANLHTGQLGRLLPDFRMEHYAGWHRNIYRIPVTR
jgi:hypothetical protein